MQNKYETLLGIIRSYEKAGICLSGGAGSSLVAVAACEALGKENVVGINCEHAFLYRRRYGIEQGSVQEVRHSASYADREPPS